MVTISSIRNVDGDQHYEYDFKGYSEDEKPTEWGGKPVQVNSLFLELDTGKFYYLHTDGEWYEVGTAPEVQPK